MQPPDSKRDTGHTIGGPGKAPDPGLQRRAKSSAVTTMADIKDDPEITLETYDKHHVKVAKSIATRSAIINMMIDGI